MKMMLMTKMNPSRMMTCKEHRMVTQRTAKEAKLVVNLVKDANQVAREARGVHGDEL